MLLLFFLPIVSSQGQEKDLKVTATVDTTRVGIGEPVTLTVAVEAKKNKGISEPQLPDLKDFVVTGQWNSLQSRTLFIQGQLEHVSTQFFHYKLEPQVKGTLKIDSVVVTVGGQDVKTEPILIEVTDKGSKSQGSQPKKPSESPFRQDPFFSNMDDMFQSFFQSPFGFPQRGQQGGEDINENDSFSVHLEVDKTEVYVGEQVTASWYLYTPHQMRDIDTLKYPSLKGFWKEDIQLVTQLNFKTDIVNGQKYRKALLASYALFPMKAGFSEIDSYEVRSTVVSGTYFMGMGRGQKYTKSSRPLQIKVKPLPKDDVPSDFAGAVGQFKIEAQLEKTKVKMNEPFTLKLKIFGKGNAKSIKLPQLLLPSHLELYSTRDKSKFYKNGTSFKEFHLLLIPRRMGTVQIPALSVSSFDPQIEKYVKLSTKPITLQVLADQSESISNYPLVDGNQKEKQRILPPISGQWETGEPVNQWKRLVFWSIVYFLLILGVLWKVKTLGVFGKKKKSTQRVSCKIYGIKKISFI